MLSTTSKYAVRALVELAQTADGERVLGQDLARRAGLPANYLSKILASLSKAGVVEGSRGSGGGYRLRRAPTELSLREIVELLEGPQRELECLLRPGQACSSAEPCTAHREWARMREHYLEFLEGTSVADLARRPERPEPIADVFGVDRGSIVKEDLV